MIPCQIDFVLQKKNKYLTSSAFDFVMSFQEIVNTQFWAFPRIFF